MRAARNPFLLVDHDRYGWVDADPDPDAMERRRQRTRRREVINAFLQRRSYYAVLDYLSHGAPQLPRFFSLSEAVAHFAAELRLPHGALTICEVRARLVIARYFTLAGSTWL